MIVFYLLDTTYILPFFGIDVRLERIRENLERLLRSEPALLATTTCSLIEGKWKAIRTYQQTENEAYLRYANDALVGLSHGTRFKIIIPWSNGDINSLSDELLVCGHPDYMDCWIAGSAVALNSILLTEDSELEKILKIIPDTKTLVVWSWDEFISKISKNKK